MTFKASRKSMILWTPFNTFGLSGVHCLRVSVPVCVQGLPKFIGATDSPNPTPPLLKRIRRHFLCIRLKRNEPEDIYNEDCHSACGLGTGHRIQIERL